ncbi:Hypothetical predicted protein [Paramuricea clavata]|uniref:Uncharacterized protein n=1 Tax=Paramuricea clavata TaxID=317549 RepID=A0A6S7GX54_PARCT|nr:Hypothetical predicted protein [Paramuricea clavata]
MALNTNLLPSVEYTNGDSPLESTCRGYFIGEPTSDENRTEEHCSSSSSSPRIVPAVHHNGSTPLPVPGNNSVRNQAQCQNSLSAGSWQLVSGPGSLCSTAGSDGFHPSLAKRLEEYGPNSLSSCEEAVEESVRRTRLETVRSLFLNVYKDTFGDSENQSSNVTLSKLFNHVTDKLKPPWGR